MKIYQLNFCSDEDAECVLDEKWSCAVEAIRSMLLGPSQLFTTLDRAIAAAQEMMDAEVSEFNENIEDGEQKSELVLLGFEQTNEARWEAAVETGHGNYYAVIVRTEIAD